MKYVIGADVALRLARERAEIATGHQLLAPTLLRSQVLAQLFEAVRAGKLVRKEADSQLDYLRRLRMRLLGDRVLQRVAWQLAEQLGWPDTYAAEYLALTRLQADAFVTLDTKLARAVKGTVALATFDDLLGR
jgi:predicted nucleic acid-binding protein